MKLNDLFIRFLKWRANNLSDAFFVLILSVLIGFLSGIAAGLLKFTVISIRDKLFSYYSDSEQIILLFILPLIGILLTVIFLKYIIRDDVGHGVPRILYVISKLDASMRRHKIFSSLVGGSLTAGFGGSVGLESPIISTGASLGSTIGQWMRLGYKHKTLLIGCGAAGAMASIFTTPIAAVVFGFEVLLLDLSTASLIPLLMSSVTGAVTTKLLTAEQYLVHFKVSEDFAIQDIPYFIVLGIVAGFVAVYFHFMHFKIIKFFNRFHSIWVKALVGGSALGILLYLFPPLYSEGYEAIRTIVSGHAEDLLNYTFLEGTQFYAALLIFTTLLIFFKVIATTLTTEAGGVGGIFAPAAVMGGFTGFTLSRGLNDIFKTLGLHEGNFTLVGMAAVLGGVLMAPLTAIFLIAEMANGYEIIVPLMLSTAIAYLIAKTFNKHSIFTQTLAEKGYLFQFRDKAVLHQLKIRELLEKDVITVSINSTLGELIEKIKISKRNFFAAVDEQETFIGLILLDDIRKDMFNRENYNNPISDYLHVMMADEKVSVDTDVQDVINKFNKTNNYNMIVVDGNKYVGVISRANLLKAYRDSMISDDERY